MQIQIKITNIDPSSVKQQYRIEKLDDWLLHNKFNVVRQLSEDNTELNYMCTPIKLEEKANVG